MRSRVVPVENASAAVLQEGGRKHEAQQRHALGVALRLLHRVDPCLAK